MSDATGMSEDVFPEDFIPLRRAEFARGACPTTVLAALAAAVCLTATAFTLATWTLSAPPAKKAHLALGTGTAAVITPAPVRQAAALADTAIYGPLLDPAAMGVVPPSLADSAPLDSIFAWADPAGVPAPAAEPGPVADAVPPTPPLPPARVAALVEPPLAPADADDVLPLPRPVLPLVVESVPLPTPRPPDADQQEIQDNPAPLRGPRRAFMPRSRRSVVAVAPPDNRSFFQKLFNLHPTPGPALAYAAPEDGAFGKNERLTGVPAMTPSTSFWGGGGGDQYTAVYDISAHTVTLPNGERLEAHSGLGGMLDDPRTVHIRNRGATPPHLYDLEARAQLFHGVRALRLNPVGGGGVYGRNGLLAHSFMLGPNGDSNGCVSFRNYNAFLQAYLSGQIKRLSVVASR